jgi:SprT protein
MIFGFLKKKPQPVLSTSRSSLKQIFEEKVPPAAVSYLLQLWEAHPFNFTLSGSRKTCLGNYSFRNQQHHITINGDANPFSFLITCVHEIAHQHVVLFHKSKTRRHLLPHGIEWKTTFQKLMLPVLTEEIFPSDVLLCLRNHMQNPAASSTRDSALMKTLKGYSNQEITTGHTLGALSEGKMFIFNKKKYKKVQDRRTRSLVECVKTKMRYTIPRHAEVEPVS